MLKFTDIMRFPGQFSKRESLIQKIDIKLADVQDSPEKISLGGITTSSTEYVQKIEVEKIKGQLDLQSSIQVQCSCQSFQYEFAGPLLRVDGLLGKEFFMYDILKHKPKKKNPNQVVGVCKHLVKFSRFIWSRKSLPNYGLTQNVMLQRKYAMASQQINMNKFSQRDPYQRGNPQELLRKQREQKRLAALIN